MLLKNANGQLPLNAATFKSIAVIGSHADVAVLSGGGSAQVTPTGGRFHSPAPLSQPARLGGGDVGSVVAACGHSRRWRPAQR